MNTNLILLIDDDEILLELLGDHIRAARYRCLTANTGVKGLELAAGQRPNLVVLDVMMPEMSGWEVCKHLRNDSSVPIILLTAKGEEFDKLRGFRLGVDDYVTKPFSFAELVARIGAVLARVGTSGKYMQQATSGKYMQQATSGNVAIDFDKHQVSVADEFVELTPTEYRLLETLARRPNQAISTENLMAAVWGAEYQGQVEQVKHYIWSLRRKLEKDPGNPDHIVTVRGFGYRFE